MVFVVGQGCVCNSKTPGVSGVLLKGQERTDKRYLTIGCDTSGILLQVVQLMTVECF